VLPAQNGKRDHLALFVFTAGEGVRERAEKAKNDGYYFRLQGPQGLRCSHSARASADSIREDRGPPRPTRRRGSTWVSRYAPASCNRDRPIEPRALKIPAPKGQTPTLTENVTSPFRALSRDVTSSSGETCHRVPTAPSPAT
jgi:hypothetical protein